MRTSLVYSRGGGGCTGTMKLIPLILAACEPLSVGHYQDRFNWECWLVKQKKCSDIQKTSQSRSRICGFRARF